MVPLIVQLNKKSKANLVIFYFMTGKRIKGDSSQNLSKDRLNQGYFNPRRCSMIDLGSRGDPQQHGLVAEECVTGGFDVLINRSPT